MDKRVYAVGPMHQRMMFEEPALYIEFVEDVEPLLEMDDLEGVAPGDVNGAFDHRYGGECAAELIYLFRTVSNRMSLLTCMLE